MGKNRLTRSGVLTLGVGLLTACGSGGGGGGGNITTLQEPMSGHIHITASDPTDRQVQVAPDSTIQLTFDSPIFQGSVSSGQVRLVTGGEAPVLGTYSLSAGQRVLTFTPMEGMRANRDYTLTVDTLVYDAGYRTLAAPWQITFRTLDQVPPTIASTTPVHGQTGLDPQADLTVSFSEEMDPASITASSVLLRDSNGEVDCTLSYSGTTLTVDPLRDLQGNRDYTFSIRGNVQGVKDRSGNPLAADQVIGFRTGSDTTPPVLVSTLPPPGSTLLSPHTRFRLVFDDTIDPWSVEPTTIALRDDANSIIPITVTWSADGRTGVVNPATTLNPVRQYSILIAGGIEGMMNPSGTAVATSQTLTFDVQDDDTAPRMTESVPLADAVGCAVNTVAEVVFDRAMCPASFTTETVTLARSGTPVSATVALAADKVTLIVTPAATLATETSYTLTVKGGDFGVLSAGFLPLAQDLTITFKTTADATLPAATIFPADGTGQVPITSGFVALFNKAVDPDTVTSTSVRLRDSVTHNDISGRLTVEREGRVIRYDPDGFLPSSTGVYFEILGGPYGVKDSGGNWLSENVRSTVSVGYNTDTTPPVAWLSLNHIDSSRNSDLDLPSFGFSIDVTATDPGAYAVDPTSLAVWVEGSGTFYPESAEIFATMQVLNQGSLSCTIPPSLPFADGQVTIYASLADLSGNRSQTRVIKATVRGLSDADRPLERNQVVYLDFATDRENGGGDGKADWVQDLVDYGLLSPTDQSGTNATMQQILEAGVIAKVNELFGRNPDGTHTDGAVAIRFVTQVPPANIPYTHMAIGGQDPQGGLRTLGQDSTGVLGRAWYDRKNTNYADNNSVVNPGLGIFPGELFLYQGNLHRQLYPGYLTSFGSRFRLLSPHFGGTPVGDNLLDKTVIDPAFVYETASAAERSRYLAIFEAADDLAVAVGTLLAHEVGHSLGLVTPGPCPGGLHGDTSLHCSPASFGQLMNSVVGYDGLIEEVYAFRPLNMAYLREQILLR